MDFTDQSFLEKEAFPFDAAAALRRVKVLGSLLKSKSKPPQGGKFVTDVKGQAGVENAQGHRFFNPDEIMAKRREQMDHEGSGSFIGDAGLGAVNFLTPKSWGLKPKAQNLLFKMKEGLTAADTKAGSFLAGNTPSSVRGKLFSVKTGHKGQGIQIGELHNPNGSTSPLMEGTGADRRPSLVAPLQNGLAVASPFLAATYLADKMYGDQNQPKTAETAFDYFEKFAEKHTTSKVEDGIVEERLTWHLDKEASMQKLSQLQDELEKTAAELSEAREQVVLMEKQASHEREEKHKAQGMLKTAKDQLIEKQAEHEELRLRTLARERSKHAVKLAEDMLDKGLIKQAELNPQIDRLMSCDEPTFNLLSTMVKQAAEGEEGLESFDVLGDYSINDMDSMSSRPQRGLSRSGQTMGEAARDLLK
jgi:hypothetical protein